MFLRVSDDHLDDLIADDYRDDPVGHETRWSEGWNREVWRQHFAQLGFGPEG